MKAQLLSDLHTEFYQDPLAFLGHLTFAPDLDFLLLPGDIVVPGAQTKTTVESVLHCLGSKARHVVFVVGNHEYYHSNKAVADTILAECMPKNFHWLRNNSEVIDGLDFYGGTLWFPDKADNHWYERELNDFKLIHGFHDWLNQENELFISNATAIKADTVVLSHHIPALGAVGEHYRADRLNRFFMTDLTDLILEKSPRLWVYGHTHTPRSCTIGQTRVECNPFGYPREHSRASHHDVIFDI